ncbi:MAG: head GIN domain-containing protein [Chitinophagaceae bacterium]
MKPSILFTCAAIFFLFSCNMKERIRGNGKSGHIEKTLTVADKILISGNYDLEIVQGNTKSIQVIADENILPYIIIDEKENRLAIRTKDNYDLSPTNTIHLILTTDKLSELNVNGMADVTSASVLTGADYLKLEIVGSGDISLQVNTPSLSAHIAGMGDIKLSGETKDLKIMIDGEGDFKSSNLKAENVSIIINGTGNADVFASTKLDVKISGSGDVSYLGNPQLTQHIAGSGKIKQAQQ